jgi:hypothetical protein
MEWNESTKEPKSEAVVKRKETTELGNELRGMQRTGVWHRSHLTNKNMKVFEKVLSNEHVLSLKCKI